MTYLIGPPDTAWYGKDQMISPWAYGLSHKYTGQWAFWATYHRTMGKAHEMVHQLLHMDLRD